MRSEQEMLELIVGFAEGDGRIRAVIMNGSRVNPYAPRDCFQDYDIVYIVTDMDSFIGDRNWIDRFGERIIMQMPDVYDNPNEERYDRFAYLMLFADGNRIDLTLFPLERLAQLGEDSLSLILLDKDGILGTYPPPSDADYIPGPPTDLQYDGCCNNFWWVSTYIAKGLWRGELTYAKAMFEGPVREVLIRMLSWHVGIHTGFSADPGKLGKYLVNHLEPRLWEKLVETFPDADNERMWRSLFIMGELFRETAVEVGRHLGYAYPYEDDARVTAHLRHVQSLPKGAAEVYESHL